MRYKSLSATGGETRCDCRGSKSDSRMGGRYGEARSLLWSSCVRREFNEFRPFSEEVTALRLGARRRSTVLCVCMLQRCQPFYLWRGVAYIVFARTPASPRSEGC